MIEDIISLEEFSNKAVLLVNVASYCGFTKQYDDLQKLWDTYKDKGKHKDKIRQGEMG